MIILLFGLIHFPKIINFYPYKFFISFAIQMIIGIEKVNKILTKQRIKLLSQNNINFNPKYKFIIIIYLISNLPMAKTLAVVLSALVAAAVLLAVYSPTEKLHNQKPSRWKCQSSSTPTVPKHWSLNVLPILK
jgi:hypothetical protein